MPFRRPKQQEIRVSYSSDRDHDLLVRFIVCPEEKGYWSEWDGGYPGCPAYLDDVEIFAIHTRKDGTERTRKIEDADNKVLDAIEQDILEKISEED